LPAPTDDEVAKILERVHELIPTPLQRPFDGQIIFEIGRMSGHLSDGS